jgi:DNA-binding FadR family transcriptional regulator
VNDPGKVGRDAGELCGIAPLGVRATSSSDELLALEADCVLYAARGELDPMRALDEICRLLASGKNVVSTAVTGLIQPRSMGEAVVAKLEAACREGQASFHGTGIEPGWAAEVLPLTMSGLLRRIERILVQEVLDYSSYASRQMLFDVMDFGRPPDAPVPLANAKLVGATFRAPILLVADGLGAAIDDFVYTREVAVTEHAFSIAAGEIRAGTVAAQRFGFTGIVAGRPAITVEHITRVGTGQAPHWPGGRGWRVRIEGEPSLALEASVAVNGEDENDQGCLGTAMYAIHAIPPRLRRGAGHPHLPRPADDHRPRHARARARHVTATVLPRGGARALARARKGTPAAGRAARSPRREKPQQIADELRQLIVSGQLSEGDSLGREPELVERFGVSRPSLREALRILEAEGLISVVRGMLGGVVVHAPDTRMTARTAALVLQARNVPLADVHEARTLLEPIAVRVLASSRGRRAAVAELRSLVEEQARAILEPEAFGRANARFHERLVALAGNRTLSIVAEMLNEIVARAVTAVAKTGRAGDSVATRRRGIRSQERCLELIEAGKATEAEAHWREHMTVVGRVLLGQRATNVVDLMDHH